MNFALLCLYLFVSTAQSLITLWRRNQLQESLGFWRHVCCRFIKKQKADPFQVTKGGFGKRFCPAGACGFYQLKPACCAAELFRTQLRRYVRDSSELASITWVFSGRSEGSSTLFPDGWLLLFIQTFLLISDSDHSYSNQFNLFQTLFVFHLSLCQ